MKLKISKMLPFYFFIVAYLIPLGMRPMISPDEFRYAEIPRAMVETGDFVTPKLLGIRYFEKPAMGYQLTAVAMSVLGKNSYANRVPSALATGLTALLIFYFMRRKFKDENLASFASLLYLGAGLVYGIGTFAVLDSQTTLFVSGCLIFYFMALDEQPGRKRIGFLLLCGLSCGLAFLTKGFLAFVVPVVTIIPYLLWSRRFREIITTPWIPLVCVIAVAAPWSLAIHFREPYFWHYFFWIEHVQRFTSEASGQHAAPFWLLIPPLLGGIFPAALVALGAFVSLKKHFKEFMASDVCRAMSCFLIFPFLFFSASTGKLATYVLPCFPPAAILLAIGAKRYFDDGNEKWLTWPLRVFSWLLTIAAAGFVVMQLFIFELFAPYEIWNFVFALLAVFIFIVLLFYSRKFNISKKISLFFVGLAGVLLTGQAGIPFLILEGKAQERALESFAPLKDKTATIIVARGTMHAVGWVTGRDDINFFLDSGELEDSVKKSFAAEYSHRLFDYNDIRVLLKTPGRAPVIIIQRIKPHKYDKDRSKYVEFIGCEPSQEAYFDELWMAAFY